MRHALWLPLLAILATLAGCPDCLGLDPGPGNTGGGGGSDVEPFSATYRLVEATGEWSVTATSSSGTCTSATSASRQTLSLAAPVDVGASFNTLNGALVGFAEVGLTVEPRTGMTTCAATQRACPTTPDTTQQLPFFFVGLKGVNMPNPPDGLAFVPELDSLQPPKLCDGTDYRASPVFRRGRPITVAQLKSGRFVVEATGSTPIMPVAAEVGSPDPGPISGTLTYTFRLVYQTEDYDPSKAVEPPKLPSWDPCLVESPITLEDLEGAEAAWLDGGSDIPLSADGCRRLAVTRSTGSVSVSHRLSRGTRLVYDPANGQTRAESDEVTLYERTRDATGLHERHDGNGDGTVEETTDTTFSGQALQSTVARYFAPGNASPLRTITVTRLDAATLNVRTEVAGAVVDEFQTPSRERACFNSASMTDPACAGSGPPPTCSGGTTACSGAQLKEIKKQLADALKKGTDCMQKFGYDGFQPGAKGLTLIATGELNFLCSNNPCEEFGYYGTDPAANGKHDFMINTVRAVGAERAKTLFHEMLHSDPSFKHTPELEGLSGKACKTQIIDRTYACETMCFAPERGGSCACARCLNPEKYEPPSADICMKCDALGDCPGRQGVRSDGRVGNISQGVAAFCTRQNILCDTQAECDTACTVGVCRPIKNVCDKNCN